MKNKKNKAAITTIAIIIFAVFAFFESASAILNPAAVYCENLGYEYAIKSTPEGDYGICHFPDGSEAEEWKFFEGKEGKEYSYCKQKGYEMKVVSGEKCEYSMQCVVCVLENGEEVEVTKLMNLSFEEGACGDGKCVLGENYETCSQDCPSGFFDSYCDGIKDDLCDPDCTSKTDPDCAGKFIYIDVAVCADKDCFQKNKLFTQGETVYLKINNHTNLDVTATIKNSDGEIKHLTFENNLATFKSDKVGTFSLLVDFSEDGKLKSRAKKLFFYTEKSAETPSVLICNADGKCEGEENAQNCPQDCAKAQTDSKQIPETQKITFVAQIIIIIVAIISIIAIVLAYLFLIKPRGVKNEMDSANNMSDGGDDKNRKYD